MRKVDMRMSVYLPGWNNCNLESEPLSSRKYCRFANRDNKGYYCSLFMERLDKYDTLLMKTHECCLATKQRVGDVDEMPVEAAPAVSPRDLMKQTIDEYEKQMAALTNQGYPASMAKKVVRQYILDE